MTALDKISYYKHRQLIFVLLAWLVLAIVPNNKAFAQSACSNSLRKAERAYDEGNIQSIPLILKDCLKNGFKREEKIQALRLLTLSYIYMDMKFEADVSMNDLLRTEPLYQLQENDPVEFQELFETYITDPVFSLGFASGVNFSIIDAKNQYGTFQSNEANPNYSTLLGFQLQARFNRYLFNNFELNVSTGLKNRRFEYSNVMFQYAQVIYTENQWLAEFPINIRYDITNGQFRPFVSAGVNTGLLLSANGQIQRNYTDNSNPGIPSSEMSMKQFRHTLHVAYAAGVGLKYQIKKGYIIFELKHNFSITNMMKSSQRFDNQNYMFKYYYIENDFKFSDAEFSIGYTQSFYNPRKKKMYREVNQ